MIALSGVDLQLITRAPGTVAVTSVWLDLTARGNAHVLSIISLMKTIPLVEVSIQQNHKCHACARCLSERKKEIKGRLPFL